MTDYLIVALLVAVAVVTVYRFFGEAVRTEIGAVATDILSGPPAGQDAAGPPRGD